MAIFVMDTKDVILLKNGIDLLENCVVNGTDSEVDIHDVVNNIKKYYNECFGEEYEFDD